MPWMLWLVSAAMLRAQGVMPEPKACAIPLLRALPSPPAPMPQAKPLAKMGFAMEQARVPAPACADWNGVRMHVPAQAGAPPR